jgi:hypothetical protein
LAETWNQVIETQGTAWGIPADKITELKNLTQENKDLLAAVKSSGRTQVNTEQCRIGFKKLEEMMRFFYNNFFNSPPRTGDERIALKLPVKDIHPTKISKPDVEPEVSLTIPTSHAIEFHFRQRDGETSTDSRSLHAYFTRWGLLPKTGTAAPEQSAADPRILTKVPTRPEHLPIVFTTKRVKHRLPLGLEDIGMTLYAATCFLNPEGEPGPYSEIIERVVS